MARTDLNGLLLIEVTEAAWSAALGRLVDHFKPGGLLFRNLRSSEATLEACREPARVPGQTPFLMIEDEGGGALTALLPAIPRALSLDPQGAGLAGSLIGRALAALDLNLNLAPTLDIDVRVARPALPNPQDGTGDAVAWPSEVALRAEAFVDALSSHGILSCGRHFPGLPKPVATANAPKAIVVDRSLAALWREDLVPYRRLGRKLAGIEISPAVHRAYDYDFLQPASLSNGVIEGLLRVKLGYQGLTLANASLASQAAGIELDEAVVRALAAGCDLALVPGDVKALERISQTLRSAADSGRPASARIEEAMARVRAAQKRLRRPGKRALARAWSQLAREFEEFARNWRSKVNA
jgi:beta-N-acetylhexosaminidase